MRWIVGLICLLLSAQPLLGAETLFDADRRAGSVQAYKTFLDGVRTKLYAADSGARDDAFTLVRRGVQADPAADDTDIAIRLLGDLLVGAGRPAKGKPDDRHQSDAVVLLVEMVERTALPLSRRELAVQQLGRAVSGGPFATEDAREDVADALEDLLDDKRLIVQQGAFNASGRLAAHLGPHWRGVRSNIADELVERLEADDLEVKRLAILTVTDVLSRGAAKDKVSDRIWDKLIYAVRDLRSRSVHGDVSLPVQRLAAQRKTGPFAEQAGDLLKALGKLEGKADPYSGKVDEVLRRVASIDSREMAERLMIRIEAEAAKDATLRLEALSAVTARIANTRAKTAELRILGESVLHQVRGSDSVLLFHRAATGLLDGAHVRRGEDNAHLPLVTLARLLAATDSPALLNPVLSEIAARAASDRQPAWLGRRYVALLFLQAGDSPNAAVRNHALARLEQVAAGAPLWSIRLEAASRMEQLSRFARDADARSRAQAWLKR